MPLHPALAPVITNAQPATATQLQPVMADAHAFRRGRTSPASLTGAQTLGQLQPCSYSRLLQMPASFARGSAVLDFEQMSLLVSVLGHAAQLGVHLAARVRDEAVQGAHHKADLLSLGKAAWAQAQTSGWWGSTAI